MRLIPLDHLLLKQLLLLERDPLTAEMASGGAFALRAVAFNGLSFALVEGGELIAGGGLVQIWPGRAEAWQLTSRHARPRQLAAAAAAARDTMDKRQRDPAFRRIEAYVRACEPWAVSFIRALGFVREGVLKAWDPAGRDVWLCARVRECAK
jgi:hypothetical protein